MLNFLYVDYSMNELVNKFLFFPRSSRGLMECLLIFGPAVSKGLQLQSKPQTKLEVLNSHSLSRERQTDTLINISAQTFPSLSEE